MTGETASPETGYTARAELTELPAGRTVHYRARFVAPGERAGSRPAEGRFRVPSSQKRVVRIGWGGDVAGQGWGIDPLRGGYVTFETMRRFDFDAFVHSGDSVYADQPLKSVVDLPGGGRWSNLVTPAKSKVAETLDEFRGQYAYNFLDPSYRAFLAETPIIAQWDDHETLNNWWPGEVLDDPRYTERRLSVLAERSERAFREWMPVPRTGPMYRKLSFGPHVDLFVLDARGHRGRNPTPEADDAAFFGGTQVRWLCEGLSKSRAKWKLIASDMPLGLHIPDGDRIEGMANGRPRIAGRERELDRILQFCEARRIDGLVVLTADVHYAAAHRYAPARGPKLWELVSGPLHAGTFGPNDLDPSFGPELVFCSREPGMPMNLPPSAGQQWFGVVEVNAEGALVARLHDQAGTRVFERELG